MAMDGWRKECDFTTEASLLPMYAGGHTGAADGVAAGRGAILGINLLLHFL
jgi:hypothetical protein